MNIRKAQKTDIPFIIKAILKIEKSGDSNTFNKLFGTPTETTSKYLQQFFEDEENLDTEFSLNTFLIAEKSGEAAGCCALMFTDRNYYLNKSELFPIHLEPEVLNHFTKIAQSLPNHREVSENKHFIEYIFVDEKFRRQGIAELLIEEAMKKIPEIAYINVMADNEPVINYYKKLGFSDFCKTEIDTPENKIYPSREKVILSKKIN